MTEASDAPSAALATVVYVARAFWSVPWRRYLVRAGRLVALPLSLVTVPLSYVAEALLVVFAPLIHLAAFAFASAQSALSLLASLKVRCPLSVLLFSKPAEFVANVTAQPLYSFVSWSPAFSHQMALAKQV